MYSLEVDDALEVGGETRRVPRRPRRQLRLLEEDHALLALQERGTVRSNMQMIISYFVSTLYHDHIN